MDFIFVLVGLASTLIAGLGGNLLGEVISDRIFPKSHSKKKTYSEKLKGLTSSLEKSSMEMDSLINELSEVAKEREANVKKIETDLANLQSRETEMKERIESLKKVPLPVAEYFAELTSQGEKKSARRDYMLFGAGAVVSTVITIILKLVFGI